MMVPLYTGTDFEFLSAIKARPASYAATLDLTSSDITHATRLGPVKKLVLIMLLNYTVSEKVIVGLMKY